MSKIYLNKDLNKPIIEAMIRKIYRILTIVICICSITAFYFPGGAFDFGKSYGLIDDIIPVSVEKEKKIGASVSRQVEAQFDEVDDPLVQKRFEEIGKRLANVCDRQELIYRFKVLKAKGRKDKFYNAFTLPGGYVYMFEPLMELMETDDKIAAVVAHELGHNTARHAVKRLQSSLGTSILMALAVAVARDGRSIADANEALNKMWAQDESRRQAALDAYMGG